MTNSRNEMHASLNTRGAWLRLVSQSNGMQLLATGKDRNPSGCPMQKLIAPVAMDALHCICVHAFMPTSPASSGTNHELAGWSSRFAIHAELPVTDGRVDDAFAWSVYKHVVQLCAPADNTESVATKPKLPPI